MSFMIDDFEVQIPDDKVNAVREKICDLGLGGTVRIINKDNRNLLFPRETVVTISAGKRVDELISFIREILNGGPLDNQVVAGLDTGGCRVLSAGRDLVVKVSKVIPYNGTMQISLEVEKLMPEPHEIYTYYGVLSKK